MSAPVQTRPITTEELLAMPEDGMDRWLINGELRERPMTVRNRFHSKIMAEVTASLVLWNRSQPEPRGSVVCGEAGFRLRRTPDSTVGVDVAYVDHDVEITQSEATTLIDGLPSLAVEILSPTDQQEDIDEKTDTYLRSGVSLVWVIDPHDRTVLAYSRGNVPKLFTVQDDLVGDPFLPGFRVPTASLFPYPDRPRPE